MDGISSTTLIAIYGAILSSILLVWNVYRDLTDRGKLRVYCYIGNLISSAGLLDKNDYLVYSVTNVGRRPILVTHVGGKRKKDEFADFIIITDKLPKMLNPGEFHLEYSPDLSVLDDDLVCLHALDSLNNSHKVKKAVMKDLIKKGKNIRASRNQ